MNDTELLNVLEAAIRNEPITLWFGSGEFPGGNTSGLSLLNGKRSLRDAIQAAFTGVSTKKG